MKPAVFLAAAALAALAVPAAAQTATPPPSPPAAAPDSAFTGGYVGILGSATASSDQPRYLLGSQAYTGGLFAGYGVALGDLYVGGETSVAPRRTAEGDGHAFTFTARSGYLAAPSLMVFGLSGWERGQWALSPAGDSKTWVDGVRLGVGAEYNVGDHVFVRGEYARTFTERVRINGADGDATRDSARVGLGIRF